MFSDDNLIVSKGPIRKDFQNHFDSRYQESPDSGEVDVYEFLRLSFTKRRLANSITEIEISSPRIYQKLRELCGSPPLRLSNLPVVPHIPLITPRDIFNQILV